MIHPRDPRLILMIEIFLTEGRTKVSFFERFVWLSFVLRGLLVFRIDISCTTFSREMTTKYYDSFCLLSLSGSSFWNNVFFV